MRIMIISTTAQLPRARWLLKERNLLKKETIAQADDVRDLDLVLGSHPIRIVEVDPGIGLLNYTKTCYFTHLVV